MEDHKVIHIHQHDSSHPEIKVKPHGFPTKLVKEKKEKKTFLSKRAYAFGIDFFLIGFNIVTGRKLQKGVNGITLYRWQVVQLREKQPGNQ